MATKYWSPNAPLVAQLNTVTVAGTIANGQVYSITINGKVVSYTAVVPTDTNTAVAIALTALLNASTYPEFAEVTWANPSGAIITGTADTAGYPFTQTSSATGTGTLVTVATTAASGPNDVSLASNWSTGALPVAADDVFITNSSQGLLYGLTALSAVTLTSLTIDSTFTGKIGLPLLNSNGYIEYRQQFFQVAATTENYLAGTGGGSTMIQRDQGSVAWTINVNNTGSPSQQGRPALLLKGTNAANVLNVTRGIVGVAIDPGQVSTFATINIGYQNSPQTDVTLTLGAGCTLTTINQNGGLLTINSAVPTLTMRGGTTNIYGTGTITTLDVEGGTCFYQSSGTITTTTVGINGTLNFEKDPRARTLTTTTVYGSYFDSDKTVTWTNTASFPNGIGGQGGADVRLGTGIHLQRS